MKKYDPVEVWSNEVKSAGRRFKMAAGKWNAQQARGRGRTGDVSRFAVTAAAIELHSAARRAAREALNRIGRD